MDDLIQIVESMNGVAALQAQTVSSLGALIVNAADIFTSIVDQRQVFPREIALAEGVILGVLALLALILLGLMLSRRNPIAGIALSLVVMAGLLEGVAFGRLAFLSPNGINLLQALFIGSALFFLSATIRLARDNALVGGVMLVAIISIVGLGVAGFVGAYPAGPALQVALVALAGIAILLTISQAITGDRHALLLLPGVLLTTASVVVLYMFARNGLPSTTGAWMMSVLPHALFASGIFLSGLLALFMNHAPASGAAVIGAAGTGLGGGFPAFEGAQSAAEDDYRDEPPDMVFDMNADEAAAPENAETLAPTTWSPTSPYNVQGAHTAQGNGHDKSHDNSHEKGHDSVRQQSVVPAMHAAQNAPHQQSAPQDSVAKRGHDGIVQGRSPVSSQWGADQSEPERTMPALTPMPSDMSGVTRPGGAEMGTQTDYAGAWGRPDPDAALNAEADKLVAYLSTSGKCIWDWSALSHTSSDPHAAELFGVEDTMHMTPEDIRFRIQPQSLDIYDEEILGGANPAPGNFDIDVDVTGRTLRLQGARFVDQDGLIVRIVAAVEERVAAAPLLTAPITAVPAQASAQSDMAIDVDSLSKKELKQEITALKAAVKNGEIKAWFQPIIRFQDEETIGFEALARWHKPGAAAPVEAEQFIDLALAAGLGMEIAEIVLTEACSELANWCDAQPGKGQFVSFNVSARELVNDKLAKLVSAQMKKNKLPKGSLVVEMTENYVVDNPKKVAGTFAALRKAGARIALDDFGKGYSNFSQFGKLTFDIVKTDKSLLDKMDGSYDQAQAIIGSLIDMARKMNMQVIAEGVENQHVAGLLKSLKCDFAQGFYYGGAEPADGSAVPAAPQLASGQYDGGTTAPQQISPATMSAPAAGGAVTAPLIAPVGTLR